MYKRKRLGPLRTVAIRNSEVGRYSGGVNVLYEWQKKSVPEVASAIWSESAIGGVRYRRFHCTSVHNYIHTIINIIIIIMCTNYNMYTSPLVYTVEPAQTHRSPKRCYLKTLVSS